MSTTPSPSTSQSHRLNRLASGILGPVLALTGLAGFVAPIGPFSTASAYNVFHIVFGVLGAALAGLNVPRGIRAFNIGFGLLDLYQAVAQVLHLFPESLFRWTPADFVVHIVIGVALVWVGLRR